MAKKSKYQRFYDWREANGLESTAVKFSFPAYRVKVFQEIDGKEITYNIRFDDPFIGGEERFMDYAIEYVSSNL